MITEPTDLWRQIVGGSTKGPGDVFDDLRKSKVGELDVPIGIKQNVLWLEIAINDIVGMQVIESQRNLSSIEFGHRVRKTLPGPAVRIPLW